MDSNKKFLLLPSRLSWKNMDFFSLYNFYQKLQHSGIYIKKEKVGASQLGSHFFLQLLTNTFS